MQTADELKKAYEAYFKLRMEDPDFAEYVIGQSINGLHNILFTFFRAGATSTGAY